MRVLVGLGGVTVICALVMLWPVAAVVGAGGGVKLASAVGTSVAVAAGGAAAGSAQATWMRAQAIPKRIVFIT